ncbi:MAG: biotin transporter BioY [Granulosicoccus sp.]|nr:biotin transporter BioY [Granulosicoccus sp.]
MTTAHAVPVAGTPDTLLERLLPATAWQSKWCIRNLLLIVAGSLLLTISAKVSIPFYPVPMTLQTLVVLCLGMALGPWLGATTVLFYLAQGAMGLPVFAGTPEKGLGLAYMLGTTGGYLIGFVVAAFVVGLLAQRRWDRSMLTTIAAMLVGNFIIYAFGLLWLGSVVGWDKPILAWGMTPFLLGDLAKILIATAVLPSLWKLLR